MIITPEKLKLYKKIALYLLIVSIVGMIIYGIWSAVHPQESGNFKSFEETLASTLPLEYQDRILLNEDKQLLGNQYVSTVIISEKAEEDIHAKDMISGFLFKAFSELSSKDLPITAITIGIYIRPLEKQYRVILGKEVALNQPLSFWESRNANELFKWLSETCPKTSPKELNHFCDISDTLKTK